MNIEGPATHTCRAFTFVSTRPQPTGNVRETGMSTAPFILNP